jgi:hypothetical protein
MKIIRSLAAMCVALAIMFGGMTARAQVPFRADSQITVKSYISVNNTTAVVVKSTYGTVYSIDAFNNSTTLAYVKLYNSAIAVCGTDTPVARYLIPFGASSAGGGFSVPNINGDVYPSGLSMCITTGIADNDTGAPAANAYIVNVHLK